MNTLTDPKSNCVQEISDMKASSKKQPLKLLLILFPENMEKHEVLFETTDFVIVKDTNEAKQIIEVYGEILFDGIICDPEMNRKSISDFVTFLNSNEILKDIPVLSLALNNQLGHKAKANKIEGIDDVVSANISFSELFDKIRILKKYKLLRDKMPYKLGPSKKALPDYQYILKRILDIILASLLVTLTLPLILIIAICIKLESKGPIFYKSLRAGKWYKVFTFFKFRTMVVNADNMVTDLQYMNEYKDFQTSFFFKLKDDPRVTRVGKFLRKTSLDELPQLINVLKGDMSLVGNRPLPLYEAQTITIDQSAKRFFAPAGITGLWQVEGRSNYNLTVQERINMDIAYANNSSFLYDLKILLKTPKELIHKSNV